MLRITSQDVQPSPKADSLKITGTVRNTSRIVAAMNGVIMIASTSAAVKMLLSPAAARNTGAIPGTWPSELVSIGLMVELISGASTKKPHMP